MENLIERRMSARVQIDCPSWAFVDGQKHPCRALDLSTSGMVVAAARTLAGRGMPDIGAFEVILAAGRKVRARTRTVWRDGRFCAVRFVSIQDVDRLVIAEHVDALVRRGALVH